MTRPLLGNVRDLIELSQNNSSENSLYQPFPPDHWGLEWDEEGENLIPMEHQFSLDDLYTYGDYDNVFRSEYRG